MERDNRDKYEIWENINVLLGLINFKDKVKMSINWLEIKKLEDAIIKKMEEIKNENTRTV